MAIRPKPSGSWEVYYRNPFTGRRESVTCPSQKEAVQKDALIKYKLQFERDSFSRTDLPKQEDPHAMTVEELVWRFLQVKEYPRLSLRDQLYKFKPWLESLRDKPISEITKASMELVLGKFRSKGLKGTTIHRSFTCFKAFLHWCVKQEIIDKMPLVPELPKDETEHIIPPTPEEIRAILKVALPHIQRLVILGYSFGARIGPCELFRLRWQDVDFEQGLVRMPSSRKNRHEPWREIPIRAELVPLLKWWHEQDADEPHDYILHFNKKPITQTVQKSWRCTLERAGITRRIRPYDLRHAFATQAIAAGADVGTVAKVMGHQNPMMLLTYYQHVLDKQKVQAVRMIPCVSEAVCLE